VFTKAPSDSFEMYTFRTLKQAAVENFLYSWGRGFEQIILQCETLERGKNEWAETRLTMV